MKTAVVILNWNGERFLKQFLAQVVERSPEAQVIVADNGSTDTSVAYIESNHPEVKILRLSENYGFTGGYNRALATVDAEYYVLLNSDIEVSAGWLAPLIAQLDNNPTVAAVQPKIRSYVERNKFEYAGASGGFIDTLGYPFCRGRLIGSADEDRLQYDTARDIFWATGAAFMVRSELYHRYGGLDDNFFAHQEEIDLCWRLKRAGYRIRVEPKSVVYHVGAGTLPVWSPQKTYLNFRNNIAMLYKNLPLWRFTIVYGIRTGTDALRLMSYVASGKFNFATAIFRGHRDFWRMRHRLNRHKELGFGTVGEIYKGSIVLRSVLCKNRNWEI